MLLNLYELWTKLLICLSSIFNWTRVFLFILLCISMYLYCYASDCAICSDHIDGFVPPPRVSPMGISTEWLQFPVYKSHSCLFYPSSSSVVVSFCCYFKASMFSSKIRSTLKPTATTETKVMTSLDKYHQTPQYVA